MIWILDSHRKKKGFDGCCQCTEFESCQRFEALRVIHGDAPQKNLRIMKELRLDR